jgi:archaellum component FlaF (FlaF/FlaG flagellin family)
MTRRFKMKTITIIIAILLFSFMVYAQTTEVPNSVMDAFNKLYPQVSEVKWDKEGNNFEASFKEGGTEVSVVLTTEGKLLETETGVDLKDLPKTIASYVQQKYAGFKITETTKIVNSKNNLNYEIEITKDQKKKDLLFDKDGKLIEKKKNQTEQEEEQEDKD